MRFALTTVVVFAALLHSPFAHAQRETQTTRAHAVAESEALAHDAAMKQELSSALAPVRDASQFQRYLREHLGASSPFSALSRPALQRFSNSLVFGDRGLVSYNYRDLRRELTAGQVYQLLRVFGVEDTASSVPGLVVNSSSDALVVSPLAIPSGHHDMYCAAKGSCAPKIDWVCTNNC
jgi:hypothetical protein